MEEGSRLLKSGSEFLAASRFEEAVVLASNRCQRASALQKLGIARRLNGELEVSEEIHNRAIATAEDDILKARIKRDLGMTYLDKGDYNLAYDILDISYRTLLNHHEPIEAAMSRGFQGRVKLLQGSRKQAVSLLREVDKVLRGGDNRDYELNNLIWLMRASYRTRFTGSWRAVRLIKQTEQSRRWKELVVIIIGGNWLHTHSHRLYGFLRRHR